MAGLEEKLLAAMLECGASSDLARIHAADFAALLTPKIEREQRERQIAELFPTLKACGIAERFKIHRSTGYRILSHKRKALATNSK